MKISASKQFLPLPTPAGKAAQAAQAAQAAKPETTPLLKQPHETLDAAKQRLKKASQEFESFITYYMLKTMRESTASSDNEEAGPLSGGFGKETFTEMFDMELSKKMASSNGRSLSGMLYKSLERVLDVQYTGQKPEPAHFKDPLELHQPKSMPLNVSRGASVTAKAALPTPDNAAAHMVPETVHLDNSHIIYPETVSAISSAKISPATYTRPVAAPPSNPTETVRSETTPLKPTQSDRSNRLDDIIEAAAQTHGLDSALIKSVIAVESHGNPQAVSPAGAKGLMQLMDSVAQEYNVDNAFDPTQNITAGAAHLKRLINRFGDVKLGLAAYNAGPGNVKKYNGIPPFAETEQYVEKVLETYNRFKSAQTAPKVNSAMTDIDGE